MKISMLLSNGFRPDPRVLKEVTGLSSSGYAITVICWDRRFEFPPEEILPCGVKITQGSKYPLFLWDWNRSTVKAATILARGIQNTTKN